MPYKAFDIDGIGKVTIYKRRGNRSLRLSVTSTGLVRVSIPTWTPYQAGLAFTMSRKTWILAQVRPAVQLLHDSTAVGKTRRLRFALDLQSIGIKTSVRAGEVVVTYSRRFAASDPEVQRAAEAACWRALKRESVQLLTPRLNQLAQQHGCTYRSLKIKRMTSRWGSCDQHQNIVFNLFLIQLPWELIDYVILHELTHTTVLNHGADFWQAFEKVLPGARTLSRQMRPYHPTLIVA